MLNLKERIINLSWIFLPTGRAWRMFQKSNMRRLFKALAVSEAQAVENTEALFDSLIPDNPGFMPDDATDWEIRLGMITNLATPFADRKAALLRKMGAPGVNPAKGHYLWIQQQLQDAGFAVWVYENLFPTYPTGFVTVNPALVNGAILSEVQQGDGQQGDFQQGGYINNVVANSLDNNIDIHFDIGSNLESTFFIGGSPLGVYASVPAARMEEFRQLILQLKQVQNIAYLYVDYT